MRWVLGVDIAPGVLELARRRSAEEGLDNVGYDKDPIFNLDIPTTCPDVPSEVLNPRNTWADTEAYARHASKLAMMLRDTLEGERYEVAEAADGGEALASVYRDRPDLVLTDYKMPGMDGLELLKKLRRDLATCQIPVVFLTVVDDLDAEAKALDLGADDYLNKPPERGRLLSRIRRSLLRAHLRGVGA